MYIQIMLLHIHNITYSLQKKLFEAFCGEKKNSKSDLKKSKQNFVFCLQNQYKFETPLVGL